MTGTSKLASAPHDPLASESTEALLLRRGALCGAAQLAALNGIIDLADTDVTRQELSAIDAALRARGVDPHGT
jgi:hypothetical protein